MNFGVPPRTPFSRPGSEGVRGSSPSAPPARSNASAGSADGHEALGLRGLRRGDDEGAVDPRQRSADPHDVALEVDVGPLVGEGLAPAQAGVPGTSLTEAAEPQPEPQRDVDS